MTRILTGRALLAALGLALALAVVGARTEAAWAAPADPGGDMSAPVQPRGLGGLAGQPGVVGPTVILLLAATAL
jgi:hypothetical protein